MEKAVGINWKAWDAEHKDIYTSIGTIRLPKKFFTIKGIIGYYMPMVPCTKFDIARKIGLKRSRYFAHNSRILSKLGYITFINGIKCKSDSVEASISRIDLGGMID
jgi:hypothetical protein